jgi:RecA-family ATPase
MSKTSIKKANDAFLDGLMGLDVVEQQVFPDDDWLVDGLIPNGVSILVGDPKMGKSFLAQQLAIAVATDDLFLGSRKSKTGNVVYLAWEDSVKRIQKRTKASGKVATPGVVYSFKPTLSGKDLSWMEGCIERYPDMRLLVIDTITYLRGGNSSNADSYTKDVQFMAPLTAMSEKLGFSIIAITHMNQLTKVTDVYHKIQGSTGQPGSADNIIFLTRSSRSSENGKLMISGREIDEFEVKLRFNKKTWVWSEDALPQAELTVNDKILALLKQQTKPLSPKDISQQIGVSSCRTQLTRMAENSEIIRVSKGLYGVALS